MPKSKSAKTRREARPSEARPNLAVLLLIGVFPLLLLELVAIPFLQSFENATYDMRMRVRDRFDPRPVSDSIKVIGVSDLDERALRGDLKVRQPYIDLLYKLEEWGARSVTFDIFFIDEMSKDDIFASALSREKLPAILAYNFTNSPPVEGDPPEEFAPAFEAAVSGKDPSAVRSQMFAVHDFILQLREAERQNNTGEKRLGEADRLQLSERLAWAWEARSALLFQWFLLTNGVGEAFPAEAAPYSANAINALSPAIMTAPQGLGFANIEKGDEEVVRRVPLVYVCKERVFPQLTLETALSYYGVSFSEVDIDWGRAIRFQPRQNASEPMSIPIDYRGRYLVNFREGESFLRRNVNLTPVVRPMGDELFPDGREAFFKNCFVIVGEVISGGSATDVEPIPIQNQFPMVGLHANVLDNILKRDFLYEFNLWARLFVAATLGIFAAFLFYMLPYLRATFLTILVTVLFVFGNYIAFQNAGWVLPVVKPVAGLLAATIMFLGYVVAVKDRDRRLVRDVFLKSVSPRIGEEILRNYHDEAIWGARRTISVLFVDIRGYTTLSEKYGPDVVLHLLEQFYDTVSEVVFRNDGQVNKFLGDAVLALFGALPEEGENHGERAVSAAIEIQQAMREFNLSDFVQEKGVLFHTGAGVNSGEATVGLVGRRRIRIEYTALGDAVNVASRLQTSASEGEVIVSEQTVGMIGGVAALRTRFPMVNVGVPEMLGLKGKEKPLPVYRLILGGTGQTQSSQSKPRPEDDTSKLDSNIGRHPDFRRKE